MVDFIERMDITSPEITHNLGCKTKPVNAGLEPCPCCGSPIIICYSYDTHGIYPGDNTIYRVICRECGLNIERDTFTSATEAWNKRRGKQHDSTLY